MVQSTFRSALKQYFIFQAKEVFFLEGLRGLGLQQVAYQIYLELNMIIFLAIKEFFVKKILNILKLKFECFPKFLYRALPVIYGLERWRRGAQMVLI